MPTLTHLSPRSSLYKNKPENWLFPEVREGVQGLVKVNKFDAMPGDMNEIKEAREAIKTIISKYPDHRVHVAFSGGKDSLLLSLLTFQAASELNRLEDVYAQTVQTGYESFGGFNQKEICKQTSSALPVKVVKVAPCRSYAVEVLGYGMQPLTVPTFKKCEQTWKHTGDGSPKGVVKLVGSRKFESEQRFAHYKEFTPLTAVHSRSFCPIVNVHTSTVWKYLEEAVQDIGVDFHFLKDEVYAQKGRDGCWCCPVSKPWEKTPIQNYIQERALVWWDWIKKYRIWIYEKELPEGFPKLKGLRYTLKYKRQMFDELKEAEIRFGEEGNYLTPIKEAYIRECWNWQENYFEYNTDDYEGDYGHKITGAKIIDKFEDYLPKALFPQLIKAAFRPSKIKFNRLGLSIRNHFEAGAYKNGVFVPNLEDEITKTILTFNKDDLKKGLE